MTLNIYKNPEEAIHLLAQYFVQLGADCIAEHGLFSVAFSGGHSPQRLYELLAGPGFREKLDWTKVYCFFGDERYVPPDHPDSNYRMTRESLLKPLQVPQENIFPVDTSLSPEAAAADYEEKLIRFFRNGDIKLDLALMGLGDNAHTASLFPHTAVLADTEPAVKAVLQHDAVQPWRITLNAPLLNNAGRIAFLVFGKDKAPALQKVLSKDPADRNPDLYPAQLIRSERTAWFTDTEAAALVTQAEPGN